MNALLRRLHGQTRGVEVPMANSPVGCFALVLFVFTSTARAQTTWVEKRNLASIPAARAVIPLAYDAARGRTVMYGGFDQLQLGNESLGDLWEWDGKEWCKIMQPQLNPGRRHGHGLA